MFELNIIINKANLFFIFFTFHIFKTSSEDTLSCGGISSGFKVAFEPVGSDRDKTSDVGGPSNFNNVPNNPPRSVPTEARYTFVRFDQIFPLAINVCSLTNQIPRLSPLIVLSRLLITKCDDCANCPDRLSIIHRILTQIAIDSGIQSLLVIVARNASGTESKSRYDIRDYQNTITKFIFMDFDANKPFMTTICELSDVMESDALKSFSKTSVLFVSISFIVLMVISLAWLIFYYIQRFRYAHAKDRLQRRLFNAAKKALTRIPTMPVRSGDKELDSDCPVCIDPYKAGDICRQLPCRHIFHKSCVDPWLLEHRTCPMCKSDILKAFGYNISGKSKQRTQFTGEDEADTGTHRSIDAQSSTSESNHFPYPINHGANDPFGFPSANAQSSILNAYQVMHVGSRPQFDWHQKWRMRSAEPLGQQKKILKSAARPATSAAASYGNGSLKTITNQNEFDRLKNQERKSMDIIIVRSTSQSQIFNPVDSSFYPSSNLANNKGPDSIVNRCKVQCYVPVECHEIPISPNIQIEKMINNDANMTIQTGPNQPLELFQAPNCVDVTSQYMQKCQPSEMNEEKNTLNVNLHRTRSLT